MEAAAIKQKSVVEISFIKSRIFRCCSLNKRAILDLSWLQYLEVFKYSAGLIHLSINTKKYAINFLECKRYSSHL